MELLKDIRVKNKKLINNNYFQPSNYIRIYYIKEGINISFYILKHEDISEYAKLNAELFYNKDIEYPYIWNNEQSLVSIIGNGIIVNDKISNFETRCLMDFIELQYILLYLKQFDILIENKL